MSEDIILGRNPVREALRAGRTLNKILIASGTRIPQLNEIMTLAKENGVIVQNVDRRSLDKLTGVTSHQGIAATAAAYTYVELDDLLQSVPKEKEPFLILLDEISDPHNLGAIIRTADAVGAHGVIIPQRRSVQLTATVAKASAGAIEHVPVCRINNLAQTIRRLQEEGIWVVGADMDGQASHCQTSLKGPVALVIGSEGKGLGRLVKERCDNLVKIPMVGKINSLNASVAAAVLMYEAFRQRTEE